MYLIKQRAKNNDAVSLKNPILIKPYIILKDKNESTFFLL